MSKVFAMSEAINKAKGGYYQHHCRKDRYADKVVDKVQSVWQKPGYKCQHFAVNLHTQDNTIITHIIAKAMYIVGITQDITAITRGYQLPIAPTISVEIKKDSISDTSYIDLNRHLP